MNKDGKFERGRYTEIPETENIKLPIGGKIRLGIREKNEKGVERIIETEYFVCTKEVRAIFGDEPTELTVFFPKADRKEVFPQNYEKYGGNNALRCWGDGKTSGQRKNLKNGKWYDVKCPCEHYNKKYDKETKIGGCVKAGYLKFMIPSVSIGTFYQCRVGGTVSIEECNSAFKLAEVTTGGCWAMIPFRMKRVAKRLKIPGTANMKNHWVVTLEIAASTEEIRRVMSGEILYLGQQRKKKYELEAIEPARGPEDEEEILEETEEEIKLRETKEAEEKKAKGKAQKKEIEESRAREAQLKKDREEGKIKMKSYQESKAIHKKKVEEVDKILNEMASKAQKVGINSFEELVKFALDRGIIKTTLPENIAKKIFTTNKDIHARLMKSLEPPTEDDKEKLDKMFETLKEAGLPTWKEIAYFACLADLIEPGTAIEDVQKILLEDPSAVEKIISSARIEEKTEQKIADEDIPF